ncbi:MAG: hypothetical protein WCN81_17275, partial [Actinomycetes bacterium]
MSVLEPAFNVGSGDAAAEFASTPGPMTRVVSLVPVVCTTPSNMSSLTFMRLLTAPPVTMMSSRVKPVMTCG